MYPWENSFSCGQSIFKLTSRCSESHSSSYLTAINFTHSIIAIDKVSCQPHASSSLNLSTPGHKTATRHRSTKETTKMMMYLVTLVLGSGQEFNQQHNSLCHPTRPLSNCPKITRPIELNLRSEQEIVKFPLIEIPLNLTRRLASSQTPLLKYF